MKHHALFSSNDENLKKKKKEVLSAAILLSSFRLKPSHGNGCIEWSKLNFH